MPARRNTKAVSASSLQTEHDAGTTAFHAALSVRTSWRNLRFDGISPGPSGTLIEHRRCPQCGSSLSRELPAEEVLPVLADASSVVARSLAVIDSFRVAVDQSTDE